MNKLDEYKADPEKAMALEGEELDRMWRQVRREYRRMAEQCDEAELIVKAWYAPESDPERTLELREKAGIMEQTASDQKTRIADAEQSYLNGSNSAGMLVGAVDRLVDDWYGRLLDDVEWLEYPSWTSKEGMLKKTKPLTAMERLAKMMEER